MFEKKLSRRAFLTHAGVLMTSAAIPVAAKEGTIAQGLQAFIEKAPPYDSERADAARMFKWQDDEYGGQTLEAVDTRSPREIEAANRQDLEVLQSFKELFIRLVKQDNEFGRMGFCAENFEKYVLPRITQLRFTNSKKSIDRGIYDFFNGTMSVGLFHNNKAREIRELLQTLLHEISHVFGYGEDAADLFAEVLMGEGDGVAIRERHDWVYGSHLLRGVLRQARADNAEPKFWEALAYENGIRDIWEKYSPKYQKENGETALIMSFEEWQRLRAESEYSMELASYDSNPAEKIKEANRVKATLVKISEDLDKAYDTKDTKFLQNLRSEVAALFAEAKSVYQTPATNFHKMQRSLSRRVYADPEIHDILDRLNHLGMCNADIMHTAGGCVIDAACKQQMQVAPKTTD